LNAKIEGNKLNLEDEPSDLTKNRSIDCINKHFNAKKSRKNVLKCFKGMSVQYNPRLALSLLYDYLLKQSPRLVEPKLAREFLSSLYSAIRGKAGKIEGGGLEPFQKKTINRLLYLTRKIWDDVRSVNPSLDVSDVKPSPYVNHAGPSLRIPNALLVFFSAAFLEPVYLDEWAFSLKELIGDKGRRLIHVGDPDSE